MGLRAVHVSTSIEREREKGERERGERRRQGIQKSRSIMSIDAKRGHWKIRDFCPILLAVSASPLPLRCRGGWVFSIQNLRWLG